ncbi:MFS transporter [Kurthia sibirica]|uniref:MFS transporter n=1 Tax=Kurthia sibirica TaxID=202750 RepID=A0A2U3AL82_9BACL|nr:MFS transporter [Kurthia sibirica]PWI25295.1 MFS transporter [Kurthia sibirica]GEK34643.1 putative MFS-type transporter YfkF [Kurthia sibirica]
MFANFTAEKKRFWILVLIVSISGFSQGMLLPLISIIFERDGVSTSLNGLNATGLYLGTLLIAPFVERPMRRFGYKPIIVFGGAIVFMSLFFFPLWKSVMFWFILRLFIGIGDHALHYATQTWITSSAPPGRLGKNVAIYGLSFGLGFAIGPLLVPLLNISESLPFIVSSLLCLFAWSFVFFLKNDKPEPIQINQHGNTWVRYGRTLKYAWVAFLPPLVYGFLESSLNAIFPVYAMRNNFDISMLSITLAAFSIGGIITQVPLGTIGDKIGRRRVTLVALGGGSAMFFIGSFLETNAMLVLIIFLIAGMFCGSVFSLGISYMADLTPKELLPTGNLLCSIFFSIGSLSGPFLGGAFVQFIDASFLLLIAGLVFCVFLISFFFGKDTRQQLN